MKFRRLLGAACAASFLVAAFGLDAQEMPQPAPEHALLAADVGTWDAAVEMWMEPGKPPAKSEAVETVTMVGGFWQVQEFKGTFMGAPFEGRGLTGWDAQKKKYVSAWVDSGAPGLSHGEATYDAATKTMKGTIVGPGPDGKPQQMSMACTWKSADEREVTMGMVGPDGKEAPMMRFVYKRRK